MTPRSTEERLERIERAIYALANASSLGPGDSVRALAQQMMNEQEFEKLQTGSRPGNELTTTPRGTLCAVTAETLIESKNLRVAFKEHRLALTNETRQRADDLLQQLEKAADGLWSLVREVESCVQPEKTEAIDARALVNGFLVLPFYEQLSIMEYLGFPDAGDTASKEEWHRRFFDWVRENKLTDRLRAEITKASP